jgi:hypothetical protein
MTYDATVEFKFDATYTHDYSRGFGSTIGDDDFLPEEHFLITAPAADLSARQYFKLFEKFMLAVGMSPHNIREGAMSLVLNEWVNDADQMMQTNVKSVMSMRSQETKTSMRSSRSGRNLMKHLSITKRML